MQISINLIYDCFYHYITNNWVLYYVKTIYLLGKVVKFDGINHTVLGDYYMIPKRLIVSVIVTV